MAKKSKRSNRDHARKQQCPGRNNEAVAEQLQALLTPTVNNQQLYFRSLGLRNRILNLSLMLAAVLTGVVETSTKRTRINSNVSTRGLAMV
jgi:hypothetical protein